MNKKVLFAIRCVFCIIVLCLVLWILILFDMIPWPYADNGHEPLATKILSDVTMILFALCPVCLLIKDYLDRKLHYDGIIGIITLLTYVPPIIQVRTYKSDICTCCDRYLIPEDVMEFFLIAEVICSFVCFIIVGIYSFKKLES